MNTCPLQLTIYSTVHPDPVRIDNITAVVYRGERRYYIKMGYYRLKVEWTQNYSGFELRLTESELRFYYGVLKQRGYITP